MTHYYLSDDDNAYDERLFEEILKIKRIGVWPVGYSGGRRVEFPIVRGGKVTGFEAYLPQLRKFPLDMAGFAMSVDYFLRKQPLLFTVNAPKTTGETRLIEEAGIELDMLEPMASNCTEVLVW